MLEKVAVTKKCRMPQWGKCRQLLLFCFFLQRIYTKYTVQLKIHFLFCLTKSLSSVTYISPNASMQPVSHF